MQRGRRCVRVSVYARARLKNKQTKNPEHVHPGDKPVSCSSPRGLSGARRRPRAWRRVGASRVQLRSAPWRACEQRLETEQPGKRRWAGSAPGTPAPGCRLPWECACRAPGSGRVGLSRALRGRSPGGQALPAPRRAEQRRAQAVASLAASG